MSIDGVLFTGIYTGLLGATTATAFLADGGRGVPAPAPGDLDEYEVAFLTGGSRLAAIVALVNLERRGLIDLGGSLLRDLRDSGDLDLDTVRDADDLIDLGVELHVAVTSGSVATTTLTHPVEVAALQAVQGTKPRTPWRVVSAVTATKALGRVRRGLVQQGLLYDYADVERVRRRWRWLLPVLAFGLLGLVAGGGGWPLFGMMLLTLVAMIGLARRRPEMTRRGDRLVAALRALSPAAAGMALALAGAAGLRETDPALALAVDVPSWAQEVPDPRTWRESAHGWWESQVAARSGGWSGGAGSGWSGGDGGGGGCGGGGGGGCGGGGGGCGGGG